MCPCSSYGHGRGHGVKLMSTQDLGPNLGLLSMVVKKLQKFLNWSHHHFFDTVTIKISDFKSPYH